MPATLFLWPGSGSLPSVDADSMRALYMARYYASIDSADLSICHEIPFGIQESLPILIEDSKVTSGSQLEPRLRQVLSPDTKVDGHLSNSDRSECLALNSYLDEHLVDLVVCSMAANWGQMVRPALATSTWFPRNLFYIQATRRGMEERLQKSGLRNGLAEAVEKADEKHAAQKEAFASRIQADKVAEEFGKQEIFHRARRVLSNLSDRLGSNSYFFDSISSADVAMASYIAILRAAAPRPLLQAMLETEFPSLLQHQDLVQQALFSSSMPPFAVVKAPANSLMGGFSLLESCKAFAYGRLSPTTGPRARSKKERSQQRKAAVWVSFAVASVFGFTLQQGILASFLPGRYLHRGMLDEMDDD